MPNGLLRTVTDYLRQAAAPAEASTDAELLARYARHRDGEAFALLVGRHGPLVLGVCRRALGHSADADDAFQATFLALARGAGRVRGCVPGWLYRVAVRTSRKALRRLPPPTPCADPADPVDPYAAVEWRDVRRLLDDELTRLPAKWRTPLVLCYLEGLARDEAAARLGWSLRTLHRRLAEGRTRLRARLTRRGLAPALLGSAVLAGGLRAAVPPDLAARTACLSAGGAAVPTAVRVLMSHTPLVGGLAMKLTVCAVVLAGGLAVLLGDRRPASADPAPKAPPAGEKAPLEKEKPPEDPHGKKVREAQEKAIRFLKEQQKNQGGGTWNWEGDAVGALQTGGTSALALLALLESGVKPDDEAVARGLKYLRSVEPKQTYVVGLQTQVFCKANQKQDADLIKRNVKWLVEGASRNAAGQLTGWSYTNAPGSRGDNSNTWYAVAGLHAAHAAGFKVQKDGFWDQVRDLFVRTQKADGGWGYVPESPKATHTMTASGLLCLTLAKDASVATDRATDRAVEAGHAWFADNFRLEYPPYTLYNLDAVAALGRAAEAKELGTRDRKHEWYRRGADWLLKNQQADGRWQLDGAIDRLPIISTSFALRFLASRPD